MSDAEIWANPDAGILCERDVITFRLPDGGLAQIPIEPEVTVDDGGALRIGVKVGTIEFYYDGVLTGQAHG